jgi:hypothetical protein
MSNRAIGERLVLSPLEPLIAGGPAEAFERHLRQLYQTGDPRTSLEDLSLLLMTDGAGVKSVAWEHPKRERP